MAVKERCKFCGSKHMICKGSGPDSATIGRCHFAGLMKAMQMAHTELTSGRYVDRALRGQAVIEEALEIYGSR